jgi:hypothetical protein
MLANVRSQLQTLNNLRFLDGEYLIKGFSDSYPALFKLYLHQGQTIYQNRHIVARLADF